MSGLSNTENFINYETYISQAYWCSLVGKKAEFQPAEIKIGGKMARTVAWFDKLFEGGLRLPESEIKPLSFLITGPPGSGKTTLALELCYRMAKHHNLYSLYISTEAITARLIKKIESFGYEIVNNYILDYDSNINKINAMTVWGIDKIEEKMGKLKTLSEIVSIALQMVGQWLNSDKVSDRLVDKIKTFIQKDKVNSIARVSPHILVIDSLNMINDKERGSFFENILTMPKIAKKLIIVILDSGSPDKEHEYWEYVCDNVLRLDHNVVRLDFTTLRDYYTRSIEVVKARYQPHVSGKHQLKIYSKFDKPESTDQSYSAQMRRAHPYRTEGGIFIYPSIHFYLSFYKRRGSTIPISTVPTPLEELNKTTGKGFPQGRCTAFLGCRGGHKSHLGYLHILNRIINGKREGGLIISLRDDEEMTKATMRKIYMQEFLEKDKNIINNIKLDNDAREKLEGFETDNKLEILYYPPGYITPDEFFHRMFMSIHRLKRTNSEITVLFNSLDQLSARFPLCSQQPIFIPGIIETLYGENITSIFIAVDEPGQPAEQYGLLPMADLILSFNLHRFEFDDYYKHHEETWQLTKLNTKFKEKAYNLKDQLKDSHIDVIILQVSRFSGGQQAGARGLLELIDKETLEESLFVKPGLHFTKLSNKFSHGKPIGKSGYE